MFNKIRFTTFTVLTAALTMASTMAHAVILTPGAIASISGTSYNADPALGGTVLQDTLRPFTATIAGTALTGTIQDRVVRETASGTLDFYTRVWFNEPLKTSQMILERTNYANLGTDVDFRTDGVGTVAPKEAFRSTNGSEIGFGFANVQMTPSDSTMFMMIRTKATQYIATDQMNLRFGDFASNTIPCYGPAPHLG